MFFRKCKSTFKGQGDLLPAPISNVLVAFDYLPKYMNALYVDGCFQYSLSELVLR